MLYFRYATRFIKHFAYSYWAFVRCNCVSLIDIAANQSEHATKIVIRKHPEKEATVSVNFDNSRTEIGGGDYKFVAIPILTNKLYKIELSATAQVRLVLVVKRNEKPTLWDFYGGDRISSNVTLLEIDFSSKRLRKMDRNDTATGIYNVMENNETMTAIITGKLRSKNATANMYIGLMPPLFDEVLCERCRARSKGPCGFCFATAKTSAAMDVNITIGRYVIDCLFWTLKTKEWSNDGCKVSIVHLVPNLRNNIIISSGLCYG